MENSEWVVGRLKGPQQVLVFYTEDEEGAVDNEYEYTGHGILDGLPDVGQSVSVRSVRDENDGSYMDDDRLVIEGTVADISHEYEEIGDCPRKWRKRHFVFVKIDEKDVRRTANTNST